MSIIKQDYGSIDGYIAPEILLNNTTYTIAAGATYNTNINVSDARSMVVWCNLGTSWNFLLTAIFDNNTIIDGNYNVSNGAYIFVDTDNYIKIRNQNGYGNSFALTMFIAS